MVSKSNSVIDLIFLWSGSTELNNHSLHPNWQIFSDHASLTIFILITEENIVSSKFFIMKNSEETAFIKDVSYAIKNLGVWFIRYQQTWRCSQFFYVEYRKCMKDKFKMCQHHKTLQELVEWEM